ncbi:MAG: glutamyl-tRNA reductase [Gammaproteobacteria bacterium]
MSLIVFGVNHKSAPLTVRERVSFPPERLSIALSELTACEGVEEAAILSTCNRTDLYCGIDTADGDRALEWFTAVGHLTEKEAQRYIYVHRSESAVRHVLRVASGLDSLVLGEPQILGQVKQAYQRALKIGTIGRVLCRLFQHAFFVAKRIRTDTAIGSSPVSVAFAAVRLAQQIFGDLSSQTAMLIGAGETIELSARHLVKSGLGRLVIANRTLENAHRLATEFGGYAIALDEIPAHLAEADIVISSTASETPVLSLSVVRQAIGKRKHRPVFMVDIAVPRDIDPAVSELEDVYLYSIDDLGAVIQESFQSRHEAARKAEEIIDTQVSHFMDWLGTLDMVSTICAFRDYAETIRDERLRWAQRRLAAGEPPEQVLSRLANTLTNKLIHSPTVKLRQAGSQGQKELADTIQTLFGLPDPGGRHPNP